MSKLFVCPQDLPFHANITRRKSHHFNPVPPPPGYLLDTSWVPLEYLLNLHSSAGDMACDDGRVAQRAEANA